MNAGTPIAEDLRDWFIEKLIASIYPMFGPSLLDIPDGKCFYASYSASEMRDTHTTLPNQWTYWKGIQDIPVRLTVAQLIRLIAEYSSRAEERERVLREALDQYGSHDDGCPATTPAMFRDDERSYDCKCGYDDALATPTPEQPAQPSAPQCAKCKDTGMLATSNGSSICPCVEGWDNNDEG